MVQRHHHHHHPPVLSTGVRDSNEHRILVSRQPSAGDGANYSSSKQRPHSTSFLSLLLVLSFPLLVFIFLTFLPLTHSLPQQNNSFNNPSRRVCGSVSLRNNLTLFEQKLRNCTIIVGSVHIVLLHSLKEENWRNISFPELEEITEYLLFFQVDGLKSLGMLFPNLAVIRGDYLLQNYALVVNNMHDLTEIGLTNLAYIAQGAVKVDTSPKLCYVETVNWTAILEDGYRLNYDHDRSVTCEPCPDKCKYKDPNNALSYCWNADNCFNTYKEGECHSECIGCTRPSSPLRPSLPTECLNCRNYKDKSGRCVPICPENMIEHIETHQCITVQECKSFWNGTYLLFQRKCMKTCPPRYELSPNGTESLPNDGEPCQYCGDLCEKVCPGKIVDTESSVSDFHKCTNITGNMIFKINNPKVEALLPENMRMIKNITGSLTIRRSRLTSLNFLPELQVIGSENNISISVMDNKNLVELWDLTNRTIVIENGSRVYFHYNPKLCLGEIHKLTDHLHIEPTEIEVTRHSNGETATCDNFTLNTRITEIWPTNVTFVWDYRNDTMYLFYYIEDVDQTLYSSCDDIDWRMVTTYTNNITLRHLTPYVKYKYFIKLSGNGLNVPHQTEILEFQTLSADPSPPQNVLVIAGNNNSIVVSWEPPMILNGILSHYILSWRLEPDVEEYLSQRDYCKNPVRIQTITLETLTTTVAPQPLNETDDACKCKKNNTEIEFKIKDSFSELCDYFQRSGDRGGLSVGCRPYRYITDDAHQFNKRVSYGRPNIEETRIQAPDTSFKIENLDPYTMYVFFLSACNVNRTMEPQCSEVIMVFNRTMRIDRADQIIGGITFKVEDTNLTVIWTEPPIFNSVLLTYEIDFLDKVPSVCLNRTESQRRNFVYRFDKLIPGEYQVRMRATSLAGPGKYTEYKTFVIEGSGDSVELYVLFLVVLPFVVVIVGLGVWLRYMRRQRHQNLLITDINPDYSEYIPDQWEMDRDNVEIMEVLGEGSFGLVNTGFIKSMKKYCAVKSVNPEATQQDKDEFLHEASVMKEFDTHHVVKLIGVVSRSISGSTPLVIMELMTRGDLKTLLRQSRDSSASITCAELYRMAIQIADGMAYLSSKKYVHRDLAARNCMVSADHTVKIGDFGMARDIYFNDYYRKETKGLLPVRWMAPESLQDGVFTSDSDAWSYGIVLWEMMTLAEQPYQGLANEQVFQYVTARGTLQRPSGCPDLLWDIMSGCWNWRPSARPLFTDIVVTLEPNVGPHFRAVSFYFSREGEEYRMTNRERPMHAPALGKRHKHMNGGVHWSVDDQITLYNDAASDVGVKSMHDVDDDDDDDEVIQGNGGGRLLIQRGAETSGYLGMGGRRKATAKDA